MMDDVMMKVEGVSKKFARRIRHNILYGTLDVARGMLGMESRTNELRPGEFWAVDDVYLELRRGETLALIGPNGSGKSTLLRLLNGIYPPDRGRVEIRGRVGALIAVGAGFHPLMTGRENIYLNGSILGMTRAEIDRHYDSIVDFADIGEFLDAPVKTYSSGMHVRLGFAIAIHCDPDILLVDEILAVGDARFQQKCYSRIEELRSDGKTVIFVSHNMNTVTELGDRAVLFDKGRLVGHGTPRDVVNDYRKMLFDRQVASNAETLAKTKKQSEGMIRGGSRKAEIEDFGILDAEGNSVNVLRSGQSCSIYMKAVFHDESNKPILGCIIKSVKGINLFGTNTHHHGVKISPQKKGDVLEGRFNVNMWLAPGTYFLTVAVSELGEIYDSCLDAFTFEVREAHGIFPDSIINLNPVVDISSYRNQEGKP